MMKHWRLIYLTIPLTVAVFAAILLANEWKDARPAEGVGRVPEAVRYAAEAEVETEEAAEYRLDSYTEGEGPAPEWWNPGEPMAAEWPAETERRDIGCPDWNVNTTIWGWDGHGMEAWEMDLFSRIFYREFWQPNLMLCEAGCDAMLRLWEMEGGTMYESLSHVNENGSYTYSTFPGVWDEDYDPEGLAWSRAYCEERFYNGPEWIAQYFRKGQYHDWDEWSPIPAYEIDGIYFSIGKEQ